MLLGGGIWYIPILAGDIDDNHFDGGCRIGILGLRLRFDLVDGEVSWGGDAFSRGSADERWTGLVVRHRGNVAPSAYGATLCTSN